MRPMRTLRRPRVVALRKVRRPELGFVASPADATVEPGPEPVPEAVFDRVTGPFEHRRGVRLPGARDGET